MGFCKKIQESIKLESNTNRFRIRHTLSHWTPLRELSVCDCLNATGGNGDDHGPGPVADKHLPYPIQQQQHMPCHVAAENVSAGFVAGWEMSACVVNLLLLLSSG
mmetsp:Transcript_9592/g.17205  ORF Transcript_9592/g.17205 Transcript_9592/m.17205 type:complete len:105 (-) Transcript_9592:1629-1943(-)